MANTSAVYARIDTGLKENAESILFQNPCSLAKPTQRMKWTLNLRGNLAYERRLFRPLFSGGA